MVCLGLEPWMTKWKVQMNPLSYHGPSPSDEFFKLKFQFAVIYRIFLKLASSHIKSFCSFSDETFKVRAAIFSYFDFNVN